MKPKWVRYMAMGIALLLIVLDMEPEALPLYDASAPHRLWKEEFGPLLVQKAIFDFEP